MNWFADDKTVNVRKRQVCEACGSAIDPGETALYQRGRYEGDFFARYVHPICWEIWTSDVSSLDPELGDYWDALFWWLEGHLGHEEAELCCRAAPYGHL